MPRIFTLPLAMLGAAAALASSGAALAQGEAATARFIEEAIRSNIAEIKMGELAEQRGRSPEVREFAHTLIEDHTQALQKASELAKSFRVIPPTEPTAAAIRHHEALSKLQGEEFDRAFADHMVMAHQAAIADFSEQARNAPRPEIMELAKETLPTLQKHLATAESLQRTQESG
jgi:putative membrane protein